MINKILALLRKDNEENAPIDAQMAAAALMFEVIWADHDVAEPEVARLRQSLQQMFDLDPDKLDVIMQQTRTAHDESVGVFAYTRAVNEQLSQEDKKLIILAMWQIAYADTKLDVLEEHTIRRIADLLYVSHTDFIAAKLRARPE